MFEERLMAVGRFDVSLSEATPFTVRRRLSEWGLVCVTRSPMSQGASPAEIVAQSIYTGVVRRMEDNKLGLSGAGAAALAGDEDDKGHTLGGDSFLSGTDTLADVLDTLCTYTNGFTRGQTKAITGFAILTPDTGQTPRKYLDAALAPDAVKGWGALFFGIFEGLEYRFNHDLTLDMDDGHAMFAETPRVLLTSDGDESHGTDPVLVPAAMTVNVDADDWISGYSIVTAVGNDGAADLSPHPYKHPGGGDLRMRVMERRDDAQGDSTATMNVRAGVLLDRRSVAVTEIAVVTDTDIRRLIEAGDNLWLHHPAAGLDDDQNELNVGGQVFHPVKKRVFAIRWPLPVGAGVYHLTPTDPQEVVDLTDHAEPEDGATTLEVGYIHKGFGSLTPAPPWFPPSL